MLPIYVDSQHPGVVSVLGAVIGAPLGWVFVRLMLEGPFTEQGYATGDIVQIPGGIWTRRCSPALLSSPSRRARFPAGGRRRCG